MDNGPLTAGESYTEGMPKRIIKRVMPDHLRIREHRHLRVFGALLHDPNLWHLNRRSVAGAFAVGLFMAWVPVPFQMILAAAAAIGLGVNLPIAVILVWITNPFTVAPLFFTAYTVGTWVLGTTASQFQFELSFEWLMNEMGARWKPLLLGCFLMGSVSGVTGYFAIRILWRWHVVRQWEQRKLKRQAR